MSCENHLHKIGGICCHKIIPLVFDQSYSYYEQLCAFLNKLNELVDAVNLQNLTITEFENEINELFNQFKNEMRLAFSDFQIEMRQEYADFVAQIESEWNAYKTELTAQWQEERLLNHNFRIDITTAWNTYQTTINNAISAMQSDISNFESSITSQQTTFENTITQQQTAFETAQTTRQNNFETAQTTRQQNFENAITQQQTDFENDVTQQLADYASIDYESYFGSFTGIQTDPPTINTIAASPLDSTAGTVRLYYKAADSGTIRYIDRVPYERLMLDYATICEPWASNSQCFWVVFENPIAWEYFKDSITPYGEAAINFSGDHPRLSVYCFDEITNNQITLSKGVHLASYTLANGVIDIQDAMVTVEEHYSRSVGTYQYLALGFYAGLKPGCIKTVTQPTNAKTAVYPGYIYSAFFNGIVKDPDLISLMNRVDIFSTGTAIPSNSDLDDYSTAGVYNCNSSQTVGTITNKPAAVTAAFKLIVMPTTAANRYIQILIDNTATGSIYIRKTTTAGLSSWFSLNVTAAT